jgi:hypothetical protein
MFRNYLKVAFRNLWRNKGFSIINISGFAIGMASAVLIILWIQDEFSYDRFHKNPDRLFQVWSSDSLMAAFACIYPQMLAPALKDYPEVRCGRIGWSFLLFFSYREKKLKITGTWVDPSFLTMFNFPLLKGDQNRIKRSVFRGAHAEYGKENYLVMMIPSEKLLRSTIQIILQLPHCKDPPQNTQFEIGYLNFLLYLQAKGYFDTDWTNISIRTFALLKAGASLTNANKKIKDIQTRYSGTGPKQAVSYILSAMSDCILILKTA